MVSLTAPGSSDVDFEKEVGEMRIIIVLRCCVVFHGLAFVVGLFRGSSDTRDTWLVASRPLASVDYTDAVVHEILLTYRTPTIKPPPTSWKHR